MKLSPHERQLLDEIQRGVQAEDPEFFARIAGVQVRRGRSVWGSVLCLAGLSAFMFGAVLTLALPALGVGVSVVGFLITVPGVSLLFSGQRAFRQHGQDAALPRRVGRFWDSRKDPPTSGVSP